MNKVSLVSIVKFQNSMMIIVFSY